MIDSRSTFEKRLNTKVAGIGVVGLGYVGLPLAMAFAKKGFHVIGVETDMDRIKKLWRKESYISDVPASELRSVLSRGSFRATDDFSALKKVEVILICVPTPLKGKYHPNISYIKQAIRSVSANIRSGALIILESTTYPGTTDEVILPLLERSGLKHGRDFYLCFSPERIDPGNKNYPVEKIPKIMGGISPEATCRASLVYAKIINKVVPVSSSRVAETAKLLENTFRLVNIGLIDEMSMMCHKMGISIWEVIEAAKTKPFGFMPFYPGPGVGGHCIPKDPLYLYWKARQFGFKSRFIKLASEIISNMPGYIAERVVSLLRKKAKLISKSRVLVIGATYKKDIKDLRQSPALDVIECLRKKGIAIAYHDPLIPYLKFRQIDLKSVKLSQKNLKNYDCIVIATDHSTIKFDSILKNAKCIFDARNVYKGVRDRRVVRL